MFENTVSNDAMRQATVQRFFSGIEEESPVRDSVYFQPGSYLVTIREVKIVDSTKTPGKSFFVVESDVLETDVDHMQGQVVSWTVDVANQAAKRDVQGFLLACSPGSTPNDITVDVVNQVTSADNPLRGVKCKVRARNHVTQKGGNFTRVFWAAE